jgi:hypothetical protein
MLLARILPALVVGGSAAWIVAHLFGRLALVLGI